MLFQIDMPFARKAFAKISALILVMGLVACGSDSDPDTATFSFTPKTGVKLKSINLSNSMFVSGINTAADISVTGGFYIIGPFPGIDAANEQLQKAVSQAEIDAAKKAIADAEAALDNRATSPYSSSPGRVYDGYEIRVRVEASSEYGTPKSATLTINGVSADFTVTTEEDQYPPDTTIVFPPPASFTDGSAITIMGSSSDINGRVTSVSISNGSATVASATSRSNHPSVDPDNPDDPAKGFATFDADVTGLSSTQILQVVSQDAESNVTSGLSTDDPVPAAPNVPLKIETGVLSGSSFPDNTTPFSAPASVVVDVANSRALIVDSARPGIIAVSLVENITTYGKRSVFSDNDVPLHLLQKNPFNNPVDAMIDGMGRLLVLDRGNKSIISVNLATVQNSDGSSIPPGFRSIYSNNAVVPSSNTAAKNEQEQFDTPVSIVNAGTSGILVLDKTTMVNSISEPIPRLISVSAGGIRTILSTKGTPDDDVLFVNPVSVAYDSANERALVLDIDASNNARIIAVNLKAPAAAPAEDPAIGKREVISDNTVPNTSNTFNLPSDIIVDTVNKRALVTDNGDNAVIAVHLDKAVKTKDGERSILSDSTTPAPDTLNAFANPISISLDTVSGRILVLDAQHKAVMSVRSGAELPEISTTPVKPKVPTGQRVIISKSL